MKYFLSIIFLFLLVFVPGNVLASGFYLETIGSLDVQGSAYPQYWYSSPNPALSGKAPASSTITVTVDGTSATTTSDASGTWSYQTTVAEGDHSITLATDASNPYSFTLTIGEAPSETGSIQAPETPAAGVGAPTIIFLSIGTITLIGSSIFIKKLFI